MCVGGGGGGRGADIRCDDGLAKGYERDVLELTWSILYHIRLNLPDSLSPILSRPR